MRAGQPRVVLEREAGLLAQPVDAGHDLLAGEGGHGRADAGVDAHGDGAAREENVDVAARHARSLRTTTTSAARTRAPPATVRRPGTSPNTA